MQAYSKKREINAQECVTRACGINMMKCSHTVVFIPTDENLVRIGLPVSWLDNTIPDCTHVWMTSLSEKYEARPETPEVEEVCLADFAANCRFVTKGKAKSPHVLPLINENSLQPIPQ